MRRERSTVSFRSTRECPSRRSRVVLEMMGRNGAKLLICLRID
jgi:hypothetical protein